MGSSQMNCKHAPKTCKNFIEPTRHGYGYYGCRLQSSVRPSPCLLCPLVWMAMDLGVTTAAVL